MPLCGLSISLGGFVADVVPILLGDGERLFDDLAGAGLELEPVLVVGTLEVTDLRYRVSAGSGTD